MNTPPIPDPYMAIAERTERRNRLFTVANDYCTLAKVARKLRSELPSHHVLTPKTLSTLNSLITWADESASPLFDEVQSLDAVNSAELARLQND